MGSGENNAGGKKISIMGGGNHRNNINIISK
jgi:hypothetical protein